GHRWIGDRPVAHAAGRGRRGVADRVRLGRVDRSRRRGSDGAIRPGARDGTTTIVDERHEPDLFWALRGGGGNFGVVTGMRLRLHSLDSVISGSVGFSWEQAEQIFRRYDVLNPTMPDELTVQIGVLSGPDCQPIVFMAPAWSGAPATGVTWIERL